MDEEQQTGVQPLQDGQPIEPTEVDQTSFTPPPSHKKLIIGILVAFVLVVGSVGAYFFLSPQDNRETVNQNITVLEENSETNEIKFTGVVTPGGQDTCPVDGICSFIIGEMEVIWGQGWPREVRRIMDRSIGVGDKVEVFGKKTGRSSVTIYGSKQFYLKKIESQSSVDTSDWQTYRNEEFGFEIRYPENKEWSLSGGMGENPREDLLSIYYKKEERFCGEGIGCIFPGWIDLEVRDRLQIYWPTAQKAITVPYQQFVENIKTESKTLENYFLKEFTIEENRAISWTLIEKEGVYLSQAKKGRTPWYILIIELTPTTVVWVDVYAFSEYKNIVISTFDDMLSTFKLIE